MSQPRPALRRAADADVHPALVVVPDTVSSVIDLTDGGKAMPQTEPDRLLNSPEQEPDIAVQFEFFALVWRARAYTYVRTCVRPLPGKTLAGLAFSNGVREEFRTLRTSILPTEPAVLHTQRSWKPR